MVVRSKFKLALVSVLAAPAFLATGPTMGLGADKKALSTAKTYTDWSRDLVETTSAKYRFLNKPFYAGVTGSIGERLYVLCKYAFSGTKSASLRGARETSGDFWPAASFAVSDDRQGDWIPIGEFNPTVNADVLILDDHNPKAALWIAGELFRRAIGNYRWGRITLIDNPQLATVFALDDLLPPRGRRPEGADFKQVLDDSETARFGSAAVLHTVTSIRGQFTGEFIYIRDHSVSAIEGGRTISGDFWPSAKLEAGDSEARWMTIGVAKPKGVIQSIEPTEHILGEPFRVELDAYEGSLGRAEFGKVIFSDSSFAVFRLKSIDPSITEDSWGH
jgi:hypothetical protein